MNAPTLRPLYGIDLSVTLAAPYLVHGNDPGRYGLHATLLTDPQGRPVLPGTLLAGRIAEAWTAHGAELGGADADEWFGRPGFGPQDGARRARLLTSDLRLTQVQGQPFNPAEPRHELDAARVRIDADTGSVATGALLQVEQVAEPGAALCFAGRWTTWALPAEIDRLCLQIRAALLLQTQLGAWRGVGFGRLLGVEVLAQPLRGESTAGIPTAAVRRRFALTSREPLCVATRSRRGNVFESGDVIPGAALLGALATQLCQQHGAVSVAALAGRSALARHFDAIRCSHALPAPLTGGRPLPLPQSLVSVKRGDGRREVRDAWQHAEPPPAPPGLIAFQTDWKDGDFTQARAAQGWGTTRPYLRVRTAIDTRGQASDGDLFAYQCRVAPQDHAGHPQTRWLFDLDLGALPDDSERRRAWAELADLLATGLAPLGKTDARVQLTALPDHDPGAQPVWPGSDPALLRPGASLPLLLVSDALLFPLSAVATGSPVAPPDPDLLPAYRAAFDALQADLGHPGALSLSHFFATQRLDGGSWLHGRRTANVAAGDAVADSPAGYRPLVLTEAGSVFVFTVGPDVAAARAVLQAWRDHGLPLPAAVAAEHGGTWRHHPYLPQHGYGEVALGPQHGHPTL